jgi:putative ABC transport system permease protein
MFFRLLIESFLRQRRRKMLAGIAILLGTTAVTAMLAIATTIGDRIHKELAVYGANIVVYPKTDLLDVKIGGVDVKPSTGGSYLKESALAKLKTIFWANNITGISPELPLEVSLDQRQDSAGLMSHGAKVQAVGLWFNKQLAKDNLTGTGAPALHPWWKIQGRWPSDSSSSEVAIGVKLEDKLHLSLLDPLQLNGKTVHITGIVSTGDTTDNELLLPLAAAQTIAGLPDAVRRVEVSARTKPEDAFARLDPDSLSPQKREIWYCRPYANSIAYQIREAIPGAEAGQVRRVEQSEGNVLSRISGLMWLVSAAALLAAGFAVSAAMATAVLERRGEIGLMRSLGASKSAIAVLFYAESGLLAIFAGSLGYLIGSGLAAWLGARIFSGDGGSAEAVLNPVLLPVVVALALVVAIAGSTPSIRSALRMDPSAVLRADA